MRLGVTQPGANGIYYAQSNKLHSVVLTCHGTVTGKHEIVFQGSPTNAFSLKIGGVTYPSTPSGTNIVMPR